MSILTAPWFYWAVIVAVGLPIVLVLLTELQHALDRRGSVLARPVGLLRTFIVPLGALLLLLVKTTDVSVDATAGPHHLDGARLLRAGDGAVRGQRHGVRSAPDGQLAQADADDLHRRGAVRDHRRGRGDDLRLRLGRQRRRFVHRAGYQLDRAGPDAAELGRPDHLRSAAALRAAVPDRRLGPDHLGERPRRRSELAGNTYQHRQRPGDHPELGAGRSVLRQPEPAARWPHHHRQTPSSPASMHPTGVRAAHRCRRRSSAVCTPTASRSPPPPPAPITP